MLTYPYTIIYELPKKFNTIKKLWKYDYFTIAKFVKIVKYVHQMAQERKTNGKHS